ncbi:MAG: leucine-rich repeat protein [Spirochaetales bacterium]|nr:leucine-rich repeat protein [Spirochaetales bacterium]
MKVKGCLAACAAVLCGTLVCSCLESSQAVAPAASFRWTLKDGKVVLDSYIGNETDVIVPDEIDGHPVAEIASRCFYLKDRLISVVLPDSVAVVQKGAFSVCPALPSIFFSRSVEITDLGAIELCRVLESITVDKRNEYFSSIDAVLFDKTGARVRHMYDAIRGARRPPYPFAPGGETPPVPIRAGGRDAPRYPVASYMFFLFAPYMFSTCARAWKERKVTR